MFRVIVRTQQVELHPSYFDKSAENTIKSKIVSEHKGTVDSKFGYCISVIDFYAIEHISVTEDGCAQFYVRFISLHYLPNIGDIELAFVTDLHEHGFFCEVGPASIFVNKSNIGEYYNFVETNDEKMFINEINGSKIIKGALVRLKICGTSFHSGRYAIIGKVNENSLGKIVN
eukprot:GAHX01000699.1.p1 GENE.GAHX01000699.1~~GAHX01000699.1.p1  ORF type:complete len:173 (-),score=14.66 GAHX01000699.1:166-684(-)